MYMQDRPVVEQAIRISASGQSNGNITKPIIIEQETRKLLSAFGSTENADSAANASGHIIFLQDPTPGFNHAASNDMGAS